MEKHGDLIKSDFTNTQKMPCPQKIRVLIVDEDRLVLKAIKAMMRKFYNYEVVAVKRASNALDLLYGKRCEFDLILTEIHMFGMDGFEFLKIVKKDFCIPVVLMSADNNITTMKKGLKCGAEYFYPKPIMAQCLKNLAQHVFRYNSEKIGAMQLCSSSSEDSESSHSTTHRNKEKEEGILKYNEMNKNKVNIMIPSSANSKNRVVWTPALHQIFLDAVKKIGIEHQIIPKNILKVMNVKGLSRRHVASHLQENAYITYVSFLVNASLITEEYDIILIPERFTSASLSIRWKYRQLVNGILGKRNSEGHASGNHVFHFDKHGNRVPWEPLQQKQNHPSTKLPQNEETRQAILEDMVIHATNKSSQMCVEGPQLDMHNLSCNNHVIGENNENPTLSRNAVLVEQTMKIDDQQRTSVGRIIENVFENTSKTIQFSASVLGNQRDCEVSDDRFPNASIDRNHLRHQSYEESAYLGNVNIECDDALDEVKFNEMDNTTSVETNQPGILFNDTYGRQRGKDAHEDVQTDFSTLLPNAISHENISNEDQSNPSNTLRNAFSDDSPNYGKEIANEEKGNEFVDAFNFTFDHLWFADEDNTL